MNEKKDMQSLEDSALAAVSGGSAVGREDVFSRIERILENRLDLSVGSVCAGSNIVEDLGADSLDVVDILSSMEKSFQIRFSPAGLENVKTVQDLVDLVYKNI